LPITATQSKLNNVHVTATTKHIFVKNKQQ